MRIDLKRGVSIYKIPTVIEAIEENYGMNSSKISMYFNLQEDSIKYELYDLLGNPVTCDINVRNIENKVFELCNCIAIPCVFNGALTELKEMKILHTDKAKRRVFHFLAYLVGMYNEQISEIILKEMESTNFEIAYQFLDRWIGLEEIDSYIVHFMKGHRVEFGRCCNEDEYFYR